MEYRFCPVCGSALALGLVRLDDQPRLICQGCDFVLYENSKPCVTALVVREDGKVLLTRRAVPPFEGWWDLPGGFLELGEHPEDGLRRELREETGLTVVPRELMGIYMDWYGEGGDATLNLVYVTDVQSGILQPSSDVDAIAWFSPDGLPADVAFEAGRKALQDWKARLK